MNAQILLTSTCHTETNSQNSFGSLKLIVYLYVKTEQDINKTDVCQYFLIPSVELWEF